MSKIHKRNDIAEEILKIISEATKELVIISPYIKLTPEIKDALKSKYDEILISVVFFQEKIDQKTFRFFDDFPNVMLYANEFLHTKCYLNEKQALITSMNLYAYSIQNNFELGVTFKNKGLDQENYQSILSETIFIRERSHFITEYKLKAHKNNGKTTHCTCCGDNIYPKPIQKQLDSKMKWDKDCVCKSCFEELTKLEKQNMIEDIFKKYGKYCYSCGNNIELSLSFLGIAPICNDCMRKELSPNEA